LTQKSSFLTIILLRLIDRSVCVFTVSHIYFVEKHIGRLDDYCGRDKAKYAILQFKEPLPNLQEPRPLTLQST